MMYDIIRSDERCDRAYWGRTMRGAQNDCNELPARHDNKPSRVGEVRWQIRVLEVPIRTSYTSATVQLSTDFDRNGLGN